MQSFPAKGAPPLATLLTFDEECLHLPQCHLEYGYDKGRFDLSRLCHKLCAQLHVQSFDRFAKQSYPDAHLSPCLDQIKMTYFLYVMMEAFSLITTIGDVQL